MKTMPYEDAGGFAKVDLHRRVRCGYPEVIFGQGKTAEQIEAILRTLLRARARRAGRRGVEPAGRRASQSGVPRGRAQRPGSNVPGRAARAIRGRSWAGWSS